MKDKIHVSVQCPTCGGNEYTKFRFVARALLTTLLISFSCVVPLCWSDCRVMADEADQRVIDTEWRRLKDIDKNPIPVYSEITGSPGVISVDEGEGRADNSKGAIVQWAPLGWMVDCSWPLREGDVFFNAGDSGTPVRVADFVLNNGEYVVFTQNRLKKVAFEGLKEGGNVQRKWTDASGKHSVEAMFLGFEAGRVRLKKGDGRIITVPIGRLSKRDQEWVRAHQSVRSPKPLEGRTHQELRGWVCPEKQFLVVNMPLSELPKESDLKAYKLQRGDRVLAKCIGLVPPTGASGRVAGQLAITRQNESLELERLSPSEELKDPSSGAMRLRVSSMTEFDDLNLYRFKVDEAFVVGEALKVQAVGKQEVVLAATGTILTQYGWRATLGDLSAGKKSQIRFGAADDQNIGLVFVLPAIEHGDVELVLGERGSWSVTVTRRQPDDVE